MTCQLLSCLGLLSAIDSLTYHHLLSFFFFFFNDTATTEIYTLSLHDALPILIRLFLLVLILLLMPTLNFLPVWFGIKSNIDRKSGSAGMPRPISYAVFCLKKKNYK